MLEQIKTAVIWNEFDLGLKFFLSSDDLQKFNGVFINAWENDQERQDELNALVYNEEGDYAVKFCTVDHFAKAIREGASVVVCGFLP